MRKSLLTLAVVAVAVLPLRAGDGRIPITSIPFTTLTPGHYYLTRDLSSALTGQAAIYITSNNVDLDLNGFTLTMTGASNTYGVYIYNVNSVNVHGGRITGATNDVWMAPALGGQLNNIRLSGLALSSGTNSAYLVSIPGIQGLTSNVTIEHCQFYSTVYGGINAQNIQTLRITGNDMHINLSGGTGAFLSGVTGAEVTGNTITGNAGIQLGTVTASRITGNTLSGAGGGFGIQLSISKGNTIKENVVSNWFFGIYLDGAGTGNTANTIEENIISGCNTAGININPGSTGNFYSRNRSNNSAGNYAVGAGNRSAGDNCDPTACSF
jgi:parallel beta-helix repeat protein